MATNERRHLLIFVLIGAVVQLYFAGGVLATTRALVPFSCPICSSQSKGYRIASTNSFGGQDRDFLSRAGGYQPVLLFPRTCPKCLYSGYEDDFTVKVEIAEAVKEQILQKKVLRPAAAIADGTESHEIPAWVRYDLVAQTYQLCGKTDEVLAQQFLNASWATRLEWDLPKALLGQELAKKVSDWRTQQPNREETGKQANPVLYQIYRGKEYEQAAQSSEGEMRMIAALAAVGTLRACGENTETQKALALLKTVMPATQYAPLEQAFNDSITREQGFQSKAVALFEKVVLTSPESKKEASLAYLCGELHRRLGNWDKAEAYYKQCLEVQGHPQWLDDWVKEQREFLPK